MLLRSKITKPAYTTAAVARARLFAQLQDWQERRAIVVHAPSGYGKSTLISHWIDVAGLTARAGWLSLDEGDANGRQFVANFAASLDGVTPGLAATVRPILEDHEGNAERALGKLFATIEAVEKAPAAQDAHLLVVLDDLHRARSPQIDVLLLRMLEHGPRNLHLILLSRGAPSLPLARLYAQGALTVLTTDDLRFTASEVHAYLLNAGFSMASEADVQQLTQRCEGWVAALRLGVLASPGRDRMPALDMGGANGRNWLSDYLIEEVLHRQSDEVRRFLLQTSLLDAFSAPLCAAVTDAATGVNDARRILSQIARADLFTIPLDGAGEWFRYHHLFQALLQKRLQAQFGADAVADLHRRAALWLADAGQVDSAVAHRLAAGDVDEAVALVEHEVHARVVRDPFGAQRLLHLLRDHEPSMMSRPRLLIDRCRLAFMFDSSDSARLAPLVQAALAGFPLNDTQFPTLHAEFLLVRGHVEWHQGAIDRAVETASQAELRLHLLDDFMVGSLHFLQMHLCIAQGLEDVVGQWAARGLAAYKRADFHAGVVAIQRETARWLMRSGTAQAAAQRFGQIRDDHVYDSPMVARELVFAYLYAAENHYWHDDLPAARGYQASMLTLASALQEEELIRLAELARRAYEEETTGHDATQPAPADLVTVFVTPELRDIAIEFVIRKLIADGNEAYAWQLAQEVGLFAALASAKLHDREFFPAYLAAIARGVDLAMLTPPLARALAQRQESGNRYGEVHVLTLMAWQQLRLGEHAQASATLAQAARLAAETGYTRIVRYIPDLRPLLAAIEHQADATAQLPLPQGDAIQLTDQETRVLARLAADRTYAQIADDLTISINTVREHIRNLYRKLGVRRRAQALAEANNRGLRTSAEDHESLNH